MERLLIYGTLLIIISLLISYQYEKPKKVLYELILVSFWGGVITIITYHAGFMPALFYSCILLGLGFWISKRKINNLEYWKGPGIGQKREGTNTNKYWFLLPLRPPGYMVILIWVVFSMRHFFYEPFVVPSGSMLPNINHWDIILVDKNYYGWKNPINDKVMIENNPVKRGDIITFVFERGETNYVKRVIGLPGDKISYYDRELKINDQIIKNEAIKPYGFVEQGYILTAFQYTEKFYDKDISILYDRKLPIMAMDEIEQFKNKDSCIFRKNGFECTVPKDRYFVMGDNRDYSKDSRYLGFVERDHIYGRPKMVLFNINNTERNMVYFFGKDI